MGELGTAESGVNDVKYNDWYYGQHVSGSKYPWCAVFVSWCANQAGVLDALGGKCAGVAEFERRFKAAGTFHYKGSGYQPQAGDIMILSSNGASHTGIVYASDSTTFYTVEGNSSDKVQKCSYSLTYNKLTGWGHPDYAGNAMSGSYSTDGSSSSGGGTSATLGLSTTYGSYTVKDGDTLQSIAEKYGTTVSMLMFLNGLSSQKISAGTTLKVPTSSHGDWSQTSSDTVTKTHERKVVVSYPYIECKFYTENGVLAVVSGNEGVENAELRDDIISLTTVRTMSDDCPTFTVNLVWRNDWFNNISSNDMVIITMQRPPESKRIVMYGLVDDIRRSMDFSSTTPQRTVQITGRGFNKALVNFDIGIIQNMVTSSDTGFLANLTTMQNMSSAQAFELVLGAYIGSSIDYSFSNGKKYSDYFQKELSSHSNEMYGDVTNVLSYLGSIWNFLKEIGNSPFNETYWEVNSGKPTLIHRETPFNKNKWTSLPKEIIEDYDIVNDGIGRSDLETYTLFRLTYAFDDTLSAGYNPLWYKPFYAKYGLAILEISTPYLTMDGDSTNTESIKGFLIDLFNWNIKNNIFMNGNLSVKGAAKYKVGTRVILHSENLEFYVESVTHSFNIYGSWTTTLGLTRGIEPENRFTPPWGDYDEFTDACMQAIINHTGESGDIDWTNLPEVTGGDGAGYDNDGSEVSSTISTEQQRNNMKTCYNWLTTTGGFNKAQACGILANIDQESGFNPSINGDNGTSYGLCQWHNSRKTAVKSYCTNKYGTPSSIIGQLEYMVQEFNGDESTAGGKVRAAANTAAGAYNAGYAMCYYFERPSSKATKSVGRGNLAKNTYWPQF